MKGKLIPIICWFFYAALYYTAFVDPNHAYLGMLDGARTLYLVIHVPMVILLGLFSLVLFLLSGKWDEIAQKGIEKAMADSEDREKLNKLIGQLDNLEKLGKNNFFVVINRIIWYPVIPVTFVMLNDGFLGSVMLFSAFLALYLTSSLQSIGKKMIKEIKNVA